MLLLMNYDFCCQNSYSPNGIYLVYISRANHIIMSKIPIEKNAKNIVFVSVQNFTYSEKILTDYI